MKNSVNPIRAYYFSYPQTRVELPRPMQEGLLRCTITTILNFIFLLYRLGIGYRERVFLTNYFNKPQTNKHFSTFCHILIYIYTTTITITFNINIIALLTAMAHCTYNLHTLPKLYIIRMAYDYEISIYSRFRCYNTTTIFVTSGLVNNSLFERYNSMIFNCNILSYIGQLLGNLIVCIKDEAENKALRCANDQNPSM